MITVSVAYLDCPLTQWVELGEVCVETWRRQPLGRPLIYEMLAEASQRMNAVQMATPSPFFTRIENATAYQPGIHLVIPIVERRLLAGEVSSDQGSHELPPWRQLVENHHATITVDLATHAASRDDGRELTEQDQVLVRQRLEAWQQQQQSQRNAMAAQHQAYGQRPMNAQGLRLPILLEGYFAGSPWAQGLERLNETGTGEADFWRNTR